MDSAIPGVEAVASIPFKAYKNIETTYPIVSSAMSPITPFLRSPESRGGTARSRKRPITIPLKKKATSKADNQESDR